jgi:hypothetical protein
MSFFLYPAKFDDIPEDTLVIFWTYEYGQSIQTSVLDELRNKIHDYSSRHYPFDRVLLLTHVGNKGHTDVMRNFFYSEGLTYSLTLTDIKNGILTGLFDENGEIEIKDSLNVDVAILSKAKQSIIEEGLRYIFNNRGATIKAQDHFHYVLPSGKHSDVFIRVGNIFKMGWEINFIGFALLKYLRNETSNIYCDTSSIIVAAQAAVGLKKILNNAFISPSINSFGSYAGVGKYKFSDPENSLFLMSTSTTWDLANQLFERVRTDTDDAFMITLFKPKTKIIGEDAFETKGQIGKILCDFNRDEDNETVKVYKHVCALCEANSTPINISGDEFLPEKQKIELVVVNEKQKPKWFNAFLPLFVGSGYIKCHKKKKISGSDVRELFLDIQKLHQDLLEPQRKKYAKLFNRYLAKNIPASLKIIIHLDDEASAYIACEVKKYFESITSGAGKIKLIEYKDTLDFPDEVEKLIDQDSGSILVVGSSIAQGRTILTISRDLRKFYNKGFQLFYFVAIVRTFTGAEFTRIRTNLLYSKEFGANTHTLDVLFEISIPDERYRVETPWTEELKLLTAHKEKVESNDLFKERMLILENETDGLTNELFWRSPQGQILELNPGFVFFNFDHGGLRPSQADVYFTISSILHYLRTEYKEGQQVVLAQSENHCKILDPENFYRYNDSVIQASFLRSAQNIELDYSYDKATSKTMKELVQRVVYEKKGAAYEFLFALAIKKVKLTPDDTRLLVDDLYKLNDKTINIFLSIIRPPNEEGLRF